MTKDIKDKLDPFSNRPGYIPGRCNAYCRPLGSGKLCKRWPRVGKRRCQRHGGSSKPHGGNSTKVTPETILRRSIHNPSRLRE